MVSGTIVSLRNVKEEKIYIVRGFITNYEGKILTILEEIGSRKRIKLAFSDLLKQIWRPQKLINEVNEYELLDNNINSLLDFIKT